MSHSFHINNIKDLNVSSIIQETGFEDIEFVAGYPAPVNDKWPEGFTYVYRNTISARALEVDYSEDVIQIRIFAASSPDDYELAIKLTEAIAKLFNEDIFPEDNDALSLAEFHKEYDMEWIETHCADCFSMIFDRQVDKSELPFHITGVGNQITIGNRVMEQLLRDRTKTEQEFYYRIRTLNYIEDNESFCQAIAFVLNNPDSGKSVRNSVYTKNCATLYCDNHLVITIQTKGDEELNVPLAKFPELLGDSAVWISENLLLAPALKGKQWTSFVKKARAESVQDIFEYGYNSIVDPFANEISEDQSAGFTNEPSKDQSMILLDDEVDRNILMMAGDTVADALFTVSNGETLDKPIVGYVKSDNSRLIKRLMMEAAEALSLGYKEIENLDADKLGAALVYDGMITLEAGGGNALFVEIRFSNDSNKKIKFMIPYRHANHKDGFAVHCPDPICCEGFPDNELIPIAITFTSGLEESSLGGEIWREKYEEDE